DRFLAEGAFANQAVQPFRESRAGNVEPGHAGIRLEAADLLVQGHERQNVVDSLLDRQLRVLKWVLTLRVQSRRGQSRNRQMPRSNHRSLLFIPPGAGIRARSTGASAPGSWA